MKTCQLIFFEGCPKAKEAESLLSSLGLDFEVIRQDKLEPKDLLRNYSSPSIIKDGELIFGQKLTSGSSACSFEKFDAVGLKKRLLA